MLLVISISAVRVQAFGNCDDLFSTQSACCSKWDGSSRWILLQQSRTDSPTLFNAGNGQVVDRASFGQNLESGIELTLGRQICGDWRFYGTYLRIFQNQSEIALSNLNSITFFTSPSSTTAGLGGASGSTSLTSEFENVELNVARPICESVSFFTGFRYVRFDETFSTLANDGSPELFNWGADNDLYGGQIGVDALLWKKGSLSVSGLASFGVFNNSANSSFRAVDSNLSFDNFGNDSGSTVSSIFDFKLDMAYQLRGGWSFTGGYRFLYLSGIALATEQVRETANFNGANEQETMSLTVDDELVFNGLSLGLQFVW